MSRVDIGCHHEDIPAEEAAGTRRFVRPGTLKIRANGATSAGPELINAMSKKTLKPCNKEECRMGSEWKEGGKVV
jgi:hypothetical protein